MAGFHWKWDPIRELSREMGRFLESLDPARLARLPRPFPPVNLYDADDHFLLTAELPGVEPDQLDLSISGETLTLRGERPHPPDVTDDAYRRQERFFGSWSRLVTLPERIDAARVAAQLRDGVLTVTLPKAGGAAPRQIPILAQNPKTNPSEAEAPIPNQTHTNTETETETETSPNPRAPRPNRRGDPGPPQTHADPGAGGG